MDKIKITYLVDVLLLIFFIFAGITSIIFFFPQIGKLGFSGSDLSFVHRWAGILMVGLAILHVLFHGKMLIAMTKRIFVKKN